MKTFLQNMLKSTLKHLDISISRAMLCFFSCFRTSRRSDSSTEEQEDFDTQCNDFVCPENDQEIRDEAKFLKACGTLPKIPIEIRKASKKLNGSSLADEDSALSEFHSWLPNSSTNALQLDPEMDQSPTSVHLFDEHTPISCLSKTNKRVLNGEDDAAVIEVHADKIEDVSTPFTPWPSASNIQSRNKSVRFECDFATTASKESSPENCHCETSKKLETPWQPSASKRTPKPTPLKLTDEMQTPGTVFPNNAESYANGKATIRSQYVYSVSNPTESLSFSSGD